LLAVFGCSLSPVCSHFRPGGQSEHMYSDWAVSPGPKTDAAVDVRTTFADKTSEGFIFENSPVTGNIILQIGSLSKTKDTLPDMQTFSALILVDEMRQLGTKFLFLSCLKYPLSKLQVSLNGGPQITLEPTCTAPDMGISGYIFPFPTELIQQMRKELGVLTFDLAFSTGREIQSKIKLATFETAFSKLPGSPDTERKEVYRSCANDEVLPDPVK
jgi:hypothetical protein